MNEITLSAVIHENRHIIVDLPADTPIGQVELVIRPMRDTPPQTESGQAPLTYESARAKLLAAGFLVTTIRAPEGTVELSPEELLRIGTLPPGARPSEELISEDRGEI